MLRPTTAMGDTGLVPLRNRVGDIIAQALVDIDDFERVMDQGRWSLAKRGYVYRRAAGNIEIKLHRFVLELTPEDPLVDHEDRNKLNNRKSNLRVCTHQQNLTNRGSTLGSSSKYRGVFWEPAIQKWRVCHKLFGKTIHSGSFVDEDEAGAVARKWRLENMPFSNEELAHA